MILNILRGKNLFLLFIVAFLSCKDHSENEGNIKYNNSNIKNAIEGFIKVLKSTPEAITVDLKNITDTAVVSIANTYPNLNYVEFVGVDSIKGSRIYFVGETNKSLYEIVYRIPVPKKVLEINKHLLDPNFPPPHYDPYQWILYFKNGVLVKSFPEMEIKQYLKKV